MTTTNEIPIDADSVESKIHQIIRNAFKLGFDCETIDEIDYFDGFDEADEILQLMHDGRTHYADQLQQVAVEIGTPAAPGLAIVARVRELVRNEGVMRECRDALKELQDATAILPTSIRSSNAAQNALRAIKKADGYILENASRQGRREENL